MSSPRVFIHQEFPNVEDQAVRQSIAALGALRSAVLRGFKATLSELHDTPVTSEFRLFVAIHLRMTEYCLSLEILLSKNRPRDAAILLLTLFELRLDLRYIVLDLSRVPVWLANSDRARKPWGVTKQIKAIFALEPERDAELEMYRFLSMVKHGNPVSGVSGFPVSVEEDGLAFYKEEAGMNESKTISFGAGCYLKDAFLAGIEILRLSPERLTDVLADIYEQARKLSKLNEHHVRAMILSFMTADSSAADV